MSVEKTLFLSRAGADAAFADRIGRILEDAGYSVILEQWDFTNRNFISQMHSALASGAHVVALLSPEYFKSDHCSAEWQNVLASDPLNKTSRLIVLRVVECAPLGMLAALAYWDVVPIRDNPALLAEVVCEAVRDGRRKTSTPVAGPYWRAPSVILDLEVIRETPSFTGRENELLALEASLSRGGRAAVSGLGGIGKSAFAREYAWRNRERYAIIWWLAADTETGIVDGLVRLGAQFVRGLEKVKDRRAAAQQAKAMLFSLSAGMEKPILLIFDNLEDKRLLREWSLRESVHVLLTSRTATWGNDLAMVCLKPWPIDDAVRYFCRASGRTDLTAHDAHGIAEALGGLPLALAHAAAYLNDTRTITARNYLAQIAYHMARAPDDADYPRAVFATFQLAIGTAEEKAPGSAAILCLASFFAPEAIPDELFRQPIDIYADELRPVLTGAKAPMSDLRSSVAEPVQLDEALGALDRFSLIDFAATTRTFTIHRLVQAAGRDLLGDAAVLWVQCAVAAVNATFPKIEFQNWGQCERLLPHAQLVAQLIVEYKLISATAVRLLNKVAYYLHKRARNIEALPLYERALAIRDKVLDPDHLDVARSLNNLAALYDSQGRYAEAQPLYERALAIRENALSPDLQRVANSLNNLAYVYRAQGRYDEAQPLYERALSIRENAPPDLQRFARSLNNLAYIYRAQGRYDEAQPLYERALSLRETSLSPDHPDVATSLNNLAVLYREKGRYAEALPLLERALAIRETALGPDHPDVATILKNLALLFYAQRRDAEAEPLFERALAIRETSLGPDHPDVATTLNNLGELRRAQRRDAEAEPLFERALTIREKALAPTTPTSQRASLTWQNFTARKAATPRRNRSAGARWRSLSGRWDANKSRPLPSDKRCRCEQGGGFGSDRGKRAGLGRNAGRLR